MFQTLYMFFKSVESMLKFRLASLSPEIKPTELQSATNKYTPYCKTPHEITDKAGLVCLKIRPPVVGAEYLFVLAPIVNIRNDL